jgi:photoactive yellow protein
MSVDNATPDFDEPLLAKAVERLSQEEVHALPFGVIRLDNEGTVTFYSDTERRLSRYPRDVVGYRFFTDIAPCMNNAAFRGRIEQAIDAGRLDIRFAYIGDFPSPDLELGVRVQSATSGGCWIFTKRDREA